MSANGGVEGVGTGDVGRVIDELDLGKLPADVLSGVVRPCGLVGEGRLLDLVFVSHEQEHKDVLQRGLCYGEVKCIGADEEGPGKLTSVGRVAADGRGKQQRIAVVDYDSKRVCIFDAEGGQHVLTIGPDRKSTRLNSSHSQQSRMPSSA